MRRSSNREEASSSSSGEGERQSKVNELILVPSQFDFDEDSCLTEDSTNDPESPSKLVHDDNVKLLVLRLSVILTLVVTGIAAAISIHSAVSHNEHTAFEEDFERITDKILQGFAQELRTKFYLVQILSAAITSYMEGTNSSHLEVSISNFEELSKGLRYMEASSAVFWGPYLANRAERIAFEKFAASGSANLTDKVDPSECFLCGDPNIGFLNKDTSVDVPGYGVLSCGILEVAARDGVIGQIGCPFVLEHTSGSCVCEPATTEQPLDIASERDLGDGLFAVVDGQVVDDLSAPVR